MKTCPYCAESIQDQAVKCRYCGSHLEGGGRTVEWYRKSEGRMLAGICSGLAELFGVSPTALRLGVVLLTLLGFGWGIVVYGILWVIMPVKDNRTWSVTRDGPK